MSFLMFLQILISPKFSLSRPNIYYLSMITAVFYQAIALGFCIQIQRTTETASYWRKIIVFIHVLPTLTCLIRLYLFWRVPQFIKGHPLTAWMTHESVCLSFRLYKPPTPHLLLRGIYQSDLTDFKARMSAQLPEGKGKAKASKG